MKSFQDTAGRGWHVAVNVDAVKRVRDMLDVDLARAFEDKLQTLAAVIGDPVKLVDVLYVILKPQADAAKVSDEEFGRSMSGDALMAAAEAFTEALTDFFPNARARAMLKTLMDKGEKVRDLLMDRAETELQKLDPKRTAATLIASYGNSPERSASTPAR